jgi:hypothetical protein
MNLKNISKIILKAFVIKTGFVALIFCMIHLAENANAQAPVPAAGATDAKSKAAPKSKKTTIDFEDQLIEGSRQKPELFYLLQNKDFNYKRLIRLREDFLPELRKSGEDVQGRAGSGQ